MMWEYTLAALAAMGAPVAVASGAVDSWGTGTGGTSARNGLVAEAVGPVAPHILWQGSLPAEIAQQAVIEGDVLVVARTQSLHDLAHGTRIVAHHLLTGQVLWETELPVTSLVNDWHSRVSAINKGQVYVTRAGDTGASNLHALDARTGQTVWTAEKQIDETSTENLAFTSNGDIIAGNFRTIARINAADGSTMWIKPRLSPSSDASAAAVFGERVYIWEASADGPVVTALDAVTGSRLYSTPGIGGGFIQQVGLFVGPDGTVYAPRTQNNPETDFFVAFTDTGHSFVEKWRVPLGYAPFASFGVGPSGSVYMYAPTREILRLDPRDGSVINRSLPIRSQSFHPRMAIAADGTVYLTNGGSEDGRLYSFSADLTQQWSVPVPGVGVSGPALSAGGVLVVSGIGTDLRAYQTASAGCQTDFNRDGIADSRDFFEFLASFLDEGVDFNADGAVNSTDFFEFLTRFIAGCASNPS